MTENQEKILNNWYSQLDSDYGTHGADEPCQVCQEAVELGIKEEGNPERDDGED
jgi:hypothetical protein